MLTYLHIMKTGGTTMLGYLTSHCKTYQVKSWWMSDWKIPENTECIFSHCPYGVPEKFIPGKHEYLTFLRDPVDRLISFYYFSMGDLRNAEMISMYLSNFINLVKIGKFASLENGMTRLIAGRQDIGMIPPRSPVTKSDLALAKENLKRFAFIGTLDTFDADLRHFAKMFGMRDDKYKRYRTGNRPPLEDIHDGFKEMLEEYSQYDRELYEFAKEIK